MKKHPIRIVIATVSLLAAPASVWAKGGATSGGNDGSAIMCAFLSASAEEVLTRCPDLNETQRECLEKLKAYESVMKCMSPVPSLPGGGRK